MTNELLVAYKLIAAQEPSKLTSLEMLHTTWDALDEINQSIYYARLILARVAS
jgi:hypothetical protein